MKDNVKDREFDKFRSAENGLSKVAVTMEGDIGLLDGVSYDDVQASFVSTTITVYSYYKNTILQAQVEVTFNDSTKCEVIRARRI
jgi:hypothetical protein